MQIIFLSLDLVLKIIPGGAAEHRPSIKHIDKKHVAVPSSVPSPEDTVVSTGPEDTVVSTGPEDTVVSTAEVRACAQHWTDCPAVEVTNIMLFKSQVV